MIGILRHYNTTRGYGFIAVEGGPDVFINSNTVTYAGLDESDMVPGTPFEFDTVETERGLRARSVRPV